MVAAVTDVTPAHGFRKQRVFLVAFNDVAATNESTSAATAHGIANLDGTTCNTDVVVSARYVGTNGYGATTFVVRGEGGNTAYVIMNKTHSIVR
jgi:hypothetical protein